MNNSFQTFESDNRTDPQRLSTAFVIILSSFNIFFSLTGTGANLFICVLIVTTEALYKARYLLICSLCLSDVLVSMLSQPMYATSLIFEQNQTYETIRKTLSWISMLASVGNILSVTVDRFIAIASPFDYPSRMSNKTACLMVVPVWLISLALGLTSTLRHTGYTARILGQFYALFLLVFLIIPMYGRIYYIAHKQAATIRKSLPDRKRFNKDNVALRTVGLIILTFCICWFPLIVAPFLYRYNVLPAVDMSRTFALVNTLALSSSTINPLIYCGRTREFKTVIRRSLHKLCTRGKTHYAFKQSFRMTSRSSRTTKLPSSPLPAEDSDKVVMQPYSCNYIKPSENILIVPANI